MLPAQIEIFERYALARMNTSFKNFLGSLWSRPDPVRGEAAITGELLVAKIRLAVASFLLLIPVIDARSVLSR